MLASVPTSSSPVGEREKERESERERQIERKSEGERVIFFKRNDGCLGTFQLSSIHIKCEIEQNYFAVMFHEAFDYNNAAGINAEYHRAECR